jgi:predicted Zn-dependent peptidase
MLVHQPKVLVGFKERRPPTAGPELALAQLEIFMGLSAFFGRASDFFRDNYASGLIDDGFHAGHTSEPGLGFTVFGADTMAPGAFLDVLFEGIDAARRRPFPEEDHARLLRRIKGRFIRNFNHPDTAVLALAHHAQRGMNILDLPGVLGRVTPEGVGRRLAEHLDPALHTRSIVLSPGR